MQECKSRNSLRTLHCTGKAPTVLKRKLWPSRSLRLDIPLHLEYLSKSLHCTCMIHTHGQSANFDWAQIDQTLRCSKYSIQWSYHCIGAQPLTQSKVAPPILFTSASLWISLSQSPQKQQLGRQVWLPWGAMFDHIHIYVHSPLKRKFVMYVYICIFNWRHFHYCRELDLFL